MGNSPLVGGKQKRVARQNSVQLPQPRRTAMDAKLWRWPLLLCGVSPHALAWANARPPVKGIAFGCGRYDSTGEEGNQITVRNNILLDDNHFGSSYSTASFVKSKFSAVRHSVGLYQKQPMHPLSSSSGMSGSQFLSPA